MRISKLFVVLGIVLTMSACSMFRSKRQTVDTMPLPQLYAKAHGDLENGDYPAASKAYQRLIARFPSGDYNEQAQLELARIDLANTVIHAPRDGQISEASVRVGQYVAAGSQLLFLVPDTLWVVANYKEGQTWGMAIGQPATFSVDAFQGQVLRGRVQEIAPATGSEFSVLRPDNASGNFTKVVQRVPVRIRVDAGAEARKVLVPGMSLTTAVREISSQHLVSGVARMGGAISTLLKLTFGTVAATQLCAAFGIDPGTYALPPLPGWVDYPSLVLGAFGFAILFRAARRDWPVVIGAVIVGYLATRWGGLMSGTIPGAPFGVFLGGFLLGALANLYARLMHRPGAVVREPGIILLVPGSVGFRSVSYLFERDTVLGLDTGVLLVTLLISLVAGLLFGDLLVSPRRSL